MATDDQIDALVMHRAMLQMQANNHMLNSNQILNGMAAMHNLNRPDPFLAQAMQMASAATLRKRAESCLSRNDALLTQVEVWVENPAMCERGRCAVAAAHIIPFRKRNAPQIVGGNGIAGHTTEVLLPGFGVFTTEQTYDPASLGTAEQWPDKVDLLVPLPPYPAMSFLAQLALRKMLAVQANRVEAEELGHQAELRALEEQEEAKLRAAATDLSKLQAAMNRELTFGNLVKQNPPAGGLFSGIDPGKAAGSSSGLFNTIKGIFT